MKKSLLAKAKQKRKSNLRRQNTPAPISKCETTSHHQTTSTLKDFGRPLKAPHAPSMQQHQHRSKRLREKACKQIFLWHPPLKRPSPPETM